jgi:hypothetical protein
MKKEFISYEQALALRNLGFDEPCFTKFEDYFNKTKLQPIIATLSLNTPYENEYNGYDQKIINDNIKRWFFTGYKNSVKNHNQNILSAPTYSQAFRWFRDNYGLQCYPVLDIKDTYWCLFLDGENSGYLFIDGDYGYFSEEHLEFKTYEEAELECLKKLIKVLKK